jgi:NAD(P)-dependent dehydrogenase (short-subunit alcohol dehydrogenase family)
VFALIRSQQTAGALNELAASRKNIHVLETDTSSPKKLRETAENVGSVTGGKLDVLIYNAYLPGTEAMMSPPSAL